MPSDWLLYVHLAELLVHLSHWLWLLVRLGLLRDRSLPWRELVGLMLHRWLDWGSRLHLGLGVDGCVLLG